VIKKKASKTRVGRDSVREKMIRTKVENNRLDTRGHYPT